MRLLVVAREDVALRANRAAKKVDALGGDRTFTVRLAKPTAPATVVARWCSWQMTAAEAQALGDRLREEGATVAEVTPVPPGTKPSSSRFAVFDAADWTPGAVLAAMDLVRMDDEV